MEGRAVKPGWVWLVAAPCLLPVFYELGLHVIFDCFVSHRHTHATVGAANSRWHPVAGKERLGSHPLPGVAPDGLRRAISGRCRAHA
eukprot:365338-Chlamydomonas_euryale.AAC.20